MSNVITLNPVELAATADALPVLPLAQGGGDAFSALMDRAAGVPDNDTSAAQALPASATVLMAANTPVVTEKTKSTAGDVAQAAIAALLNVFSLTPAPVPALPVTAAGQASSAAAVEPAPVATLPQRAMPQPPAAANPPQAPSLPSLAVAVGQAPVAAGADMDQDASGTAEVVGQVPDPAVVKMGTAQISPGHTPTNPEKDSMSALPFLLKSAETAQKLPETKVGTAPAIDSTTLKATVTTEKTSAQPEPAATPIRPSPTSPLTSLSSPVTATLGDTLGHLAVKFQDSGLDSLKLTLQPDAATEVTVEMTAQDDCTQLAGAVKRGDLLSLRSVWSELRQQLAPQGVAVERLADHAAVNNKPAAAQPESRPPALASLTTTTVDETEPASPAKRVDESQPVLASVLNAPRVPVIAAEPKIEAPAPAPAVSFAETLGDRLLVNFKRLGATALEVAVKPDQNTELSLRLTLQDNQVQVEARMTHGELGDLREQWTQLQQSLAAQGIRLGALQQTPAPVSVAPEMTGLPFGPGFGQRQSAQDQPARTFEPEPELELAGASVAPSRIAAARGRSAVGRGWETWA